MTAPVEILRPFLLDPVEGTGLLASADVAAASMVARRAGCSDDLVLLALALSVWAHRSGHACLDIAELPETLDRAVDRAAKEWQVPALPSADRFLAALRASPLVRVLDHPGTAAEAVADTRPLVLLGTRLATQRQFADELLVAEAVRHLIARSADIGTPAAITVIDRELVIDDDGRQNELARSVLSRSFNVLTGGPGTGKTHTLTRCLLAFLIAADDAGREVSVVVCAPTGKAATRAREMLDAFAEHLETGPFRPSDAVLEKLRAIRTTTIHRVLGSRGPHATRFAHDRDRPLNHDLVVVDETSMVPLQLMARLLEALGPDARLLLVGDDAQLESVESGSVLRDLVASAPLLDGCVTELQKVRRISEDNPIATVAPLIRRGEATAALEALRASAPRLRFVEGTIDSRPDVSAIDDLLVAYRQVCDLARSTAGTDHALALERIAGSRLLCGVRRGPLGVDHWNDVIDRRLRLRTADPFAIGRALLVTVNSPRVGLVNGDIGVVVDTDDGPRVCFRSDDGVRYVSFVDLPPAERAYAMTVHKSQGSEYRDLVVLMLPEVGSPLLTRELLYTGLTRAGGDAVVIGSAKAFTDAVERPSVRVSGLTELFAELT